jgi:hypothetical protein
LGSRASYALNNLLKKDTPMPIADFMRFIDYYRVDRQIRYGGLQDMEAFLCQHENVCATALHASWKRKRRHCDCVEVGLAYERGYL